MTRHVPGPYSLPPDVYAWAFKLLMGGAVVLAALVGLTVWVVRWAVR